MPLHPGMRRGASSAARYRKRATTRAGTAAHMAAGRRADGRVRVRCAALRRPPSWPPSPGGTLGRSAACHAARSTASRKALRRPTHVAPAAGGGPRVARRGSTFERDAGSGQRRDETRRAGRPPGPHTARDAPPPCSVSRLGIRRTRRPGRVARDRRDAHLASTRRAARRAGRCSSAGPSSRVYGDVCERWNRCTAPRNGLSRESIEARVCTFVS
jgi:hypothetical protein